MSKPVIIGITGKKGSGKSTISNYLANHYGYTEFAFADTLKLTCMRIFKLNSQQLFGTQSDKEQIDNYWNVSPRLIMQEVGYAIREVGKRVPELDHIWIRSVHRQIELKKYDRVIISDVRYENEANSIREYEKKGWNVLIIKVDRDSDTNIDTHESESQNIPCDYLIYNNSTRQVLFQNIQHILNEYMTNL